MSDMHMCECAHAAVAAIAPPSPSQPVQKDECVLCYDSPVRRALTGFEHGH